MRSNPEPNNINRFGAMFRQYIFLFLLSAFAIQASAQISLKDSIVKASIINIDLGIGIPAGDLAERFGSHLIVGGGYQYKFENNVLLGGSAHYIFGNTVTQEDLLSNMLIDDKYVIGNDGLLYTPIAGEQGFDFSVQIGQITKLFSTNPNTGVTWLVGIGMLEHAISIYIDKPFVPQLSSEYQKGYDRLSNGFMLNQYIGYYVFNNKNFVNFRAGVEFQEAFTKNRRGIDFDTQQTDDETHFDMMITLKLSWNLCIFEKPKRRFYIP
ncbi:MAG: hypothetical protein IPG60_11995 [Bacteroidetes bacterium]|nr:hypothetical protein [Bacteroidota bacterium]